MATTDEAVSKGIVKYTSRDYDSLLYDFWSVVPTLTDLWKPADLYTINENGVIEWKPEAASDPGVVLGIFLASAADMLGINLDILANEIFAPSVQQRKNAEKIFALMGYNLGWYTAPRTEVTFTNSAEEPITLDFGFNGSNFSTLKAYTDITNQSRVITYNVLPMTGRMGSTESRSKREILSTNLDIFSTHDKITLAPKESVTRMAIEGELRSKSVSVADVKSNNYIIQLPSQHIDTTAVWVRSAASEGSSEFLDTQWLQCTDSSEFITPEPRFAVTYDNYSNAQIQVSNYLNQLEDFDGNYFIIYWIDCSGVIGCVGEDVLSDLYFAQAPSNTVDPDSGGIVVSNLANTVELPHTNAITGKSPETAKEAYKNSRNYINTWDSLITLPDYNRFLSREPGVDCGLVLDCQKALEINLAIYHDENLTTSQKSKMYITNQDFMSGEETFDWEAVLNLGFDPTDHQKFVFAANFQRYTAMCFAIHNDFKDSSYGGGVTSKVQVKNAIKYMQYKPPMKFIFDVIRDYLPLKSMTVEVDFGYARIFTFYIVGQVFTKSPVTIDIGNNILAKVREALRLYFSPAARSFGAKPTIMEVVSVIISADDNIAYFDAGSPSNPVINWRDCDPEYFNPISFARYQDLENTATNLRISPDCVAR